MEKKVSKLVCVAFLVFFVPVFLLVMFVGNAVNYNEIVKQDTLVPNVVLTGIAVVLVFIFFLFWRILNIIPPINDTLKRLSVAVGLAILFLCVYIVNIKIAKCIAFYTGWDMSITSGLVYEVHDNIINPGNQFYLMRYPNNVGITWILSLLYEWAKSNSSYIYNGEFLWIQVTCAQMSIAGFAISLATFRLTKRLAPTFISIVLCGLLVCISPWKVIPYTDSMTIVFAAVAICLYVYYLSVKNWSRYFIFAFMSFFTVFGAFIKVTVIIALIAIVGFELIRLSFSFSKTKLNLLLVLSIIVLTVPFYFVIKREAYSYLNYEEQKDIMVTWTHYLQMGLNEEYTGSYNPDSFDAMVLFADKPGSERHKYELNVALQEYKNKGFGGTVSFYLRKSVMNYNDGAFGWFMEGNFYFQDYQLISVSRFKEPLRQIFWSDGKFYRAYLTVAQLIWQFVLGGVLLCPLLLIIKKDFTMSECGKAVAILTLLGISVFVMIFEGRARYLFIYTPVFAFVASLGYDSIYCTVMQKVHKLKECK